MNLTHLVLLKFWAGASPRGSGVLIDVESIIEVEQYTASVLVSSIAASGLTANQTGASTLTTSASARTLTVNQRTPSRVVIN